jgi:hypothetical protein
MKVTVNIDQILEQALGRTMLVPAEVELQDLLESCDAPKEHEIDVDVVIHELLKQQRTIAHLWTIDDVHSVRDDLDDGQAWHVLQEVESRLDCNVGICWDTIELVAHELYPESAPQRWPARIDVAVANYSRDDAGEHFTGLAAHIEREAVNNTTRASFDPASLRRVETDETPSK